MPFPKSCCNRWPDGPVFAVLEQGQCSVSRNGLGYKESYGCKGARQRARAWAHSGSFRSWCSTVWGQTSIDRWPGHCASVWTLCHQQAVVKNDRHLSDKLFVFSSRNIVPEINLWAFIGKQSYVTQLASLLVFESQFRVDLRSNVPWKSSGSWNLSLFLPPGEHCSGLFLSALLPQTTYTASELGRVLSWMFGNGIGQQAGFWTSSRTCS